MIRIIGVTMLEPLNPNTSITQDSNVKPRYEPPVLISMDVDETATGVVGGTPENVSYSS